MSPGKNDQEIKGNPPNLHASTNEVRAVEAAVKVLETHREIMAASVELMRKDVQDARDRVIGLEATVRNLPTKDWIGNQVYKAVGITAIVVGMIATILHLLGKG